MRTLFLTTSEIAAHAIEAAGFVDSDFQGIARGTFLSDRPLDGGDGVAQSAEVVFAVQVPDGFAVDDFELIEDGRPADAYREWLVPSAIVNTWSRARYVDDGSVTVEPAGRPR